MNEGIMTIDDAHKVETFWESYRTSCVPKDAGPVQIRETRKAFYGGFAALFAVMEILSGISDDAGLGLLDGYRKDLKQFAVSLDIEVMKKPL